MRGCTTIKQATNVHKVIKPKKQNLEGHNNVRVFSLMKMLIVEFLNFLIPGKISGCLWTKITEGCKLKSLKNTSLWMGDQLLYTVSCDYPIESTKNMSQQKYAIYKEGSRGVEPWTFDTISSHLTNGAISR